MSTTTNPVTSTNRHPARDPLSRWLPLAGVGYGALTLTGDLVIGDFPDEKTSAPALVHYYAQHHADVAHGGQLMILGSVFLGLFVAGLLVRARHSPSAAGVIAIGGAAMMAMEIVSGSTYLLLGAVSTDAHLTPQALQAWHVGGAAFGSSAATTVLLLGVAIAGLVTRAVPRWIAATALIIGLGIMVPGFGFLFSMLSLPWAIVAGSALAASRSVD